LFMPEIKVLISSTTVLIRLAALLPISLCLCPAVLAVGRVLGS
jgi:hypothetical protein